ncbi:MAG TPA: carbamoyltransferase C-terminal domain-containing protein [Elusimicrobiota bacterium]|nr:carbamoyltransferase C-terminal domain-containing protein [Elusimicrobiota bacterium]
MRGEPIVRAPQEALECFLATGMDILAMENFFVKKTGREPAPSPHKPHLD